MIRLPGFVIAEKDLETRRIAKEAFSHGASNYLTICEQIRFIYDTVYQLPDGEMKDDITEKLIDAFHMGKKMNSRLARYKKETGSVTGSAGSNLIRLKDTEERARIRGLRI